MHEGEKEQFKQGDQKKARKKPVLFHPGAIKMFGEDDHSQAKDRQEQKAELVESMDKIAIPAGRAQRHHHRTARNQERHKGDGYANDPEQIGQCACGNLMTGSDLLK